MAEAADGVAEIAEGRERNYAGHARLLNEARTHNEVTLLTIDDANHNTLVHKSWPKLDRAIARFCAALG